MLEEVIHSKNVNFVLHITKNEHTSLCDSVKKPNEKNPMGAISESLLCLLITVGQRYDLQACQGIFLLVNVELIHY